MIYNFPLRLTILQSADLFLIDARTFMTYNIYDQYIQATR